jgi:hydroxymethylpyrimidine pyrophosphatase-like HAD family hydrolase
VFCQGALLTDKEGNIISQESLDSKTIERILQFAEQHELAVAAFTGNDVIAKEQSRHTQNLIDIKEMEPRGVDLSAGPCTCLHLAYRCSTAT